MSDIRIHYVVHRHTFLYIKWFHQAYDLMPISYTIEKKLLQNSICQSRIVLIVDSVSKQLLSGTHECGYFLIESIINYGVERNFTT